MKVIKKFVREIMYNEKQGNCIQFLKDGLVSEYGLFFGVFYQGGKASCISILGSRYVEKLRGIILTP